MKNQLLTPPQVGEALGLTERAIYLWIEKGIKLGPHFKTVDGRKVISAQFVKTYKQLFGKKK